MQIYLIRHGQTAGNALRRYIGSTDQPLTPEGAEGAKAAGARRSVRSVFVTPLVRTQQTARILFPDAEQTVVPALREMDFGDFEDRSFEDMKDDPAYRAWVEGGCLAPCPNGESVLEFSGSMPAFWGASARCRRKRGGVFSWYTAGRSWRSCHASQGRRSPISTPSRRTAAGMHAGSLWRRESRFCWMRGALSACRRSFHEGTIQSDDKRV